MKVYEIKAAAAGYLQRSVDEFLQNNVDLALVALNQVRMEAELETNFEFTRKLLTLDVATDVGGSLDNAVIFGTTTPANIKSIVDIGTFDAYGNLWPIEWTTVGESLNRERADNPRSVIRYPTDGQAVSSPVGQNRFLVSGKSIYFFPKGTAISTYTLGIEAYTFTADWTKTDSDLSTGPWLTTGHQYLQWKSIIQLNHLVKEFVTRQEGNLAPPEKLAQDGLDKFKAWDILFYEQTRRHGR